MSTPEQQTLFGAIFTAPGTRKRKRIPANRADAADFAASQPAQPIAAPVDTPDKAIVVPPTKPPLFDPVKAKKLADEGTAASYEHAVDDHDDWPAISLDGITRAARRLEYLSSDDMWLELQGECNGINRSALGGAIQRAAKAGIITRAPEIDGRTSKIPTRHGSPLRMWRSLIYEAASVGIKGIQGNSHRSHVE